MAENKIQASTVIIVTILLTGGLFIAVNISNNSASVGNQPTTVTENNAVENGLGIWEKSEFYINFKKKNFPLTSHIKCLNFFIAFLA